MSKKTFSTVFQGWLKQENLKPFKAAPLLGVSIATTYEYAEAGGQVSTPKMEPIRDAVTGLLRPDLDYRHVSAGVMAAYLGISPKTLWKRRVKMKGLYPKAGLVLIGSVTYYKPAVIVGGAKS